MMEEIVRSEDIRGGKPVIEGTRVAVSDIASTFYELGKSREEVAEAYGVSEDEVEAALRYHHRAHRDREPVTA